MAKTTLLHLGHTQKKLDNNNTLYYNVGITVVWDEKKALSNFKKHGIAFEEAATVLLAENALELEDLRHNEQRFIIIGVSASTRLLTVVYAYRNEHQIRIISARKATRKESRQYEERI